MDLYDPENAVFIAYGALLLLALIPIYAGSFSSLKKVLFNQTHISQTTMTNKTLAKFYPLMMLKCFPSMAVYRFYPCIWFVITFIF